MCFLAFLHQYLHIFSFQSHQLLFSHASAKVRGENTPERKVASTGDRTHNHQVMSPTRSPLSQPDWALEGLTFILFIVIFISYKSFFVIINTDFGSQLLCFTYI